MTKYDTIKSVIFLPIIFYTEKDQSLYQLLKESGYFDIYKDVQEEDIVNILNEYPESAESWLQLSENKRTGSGWFFKSNGGGEYIVGYFSAEGKSQEIKYTDIKKACASFIKREIEEIRRS